MKLVSRGFVQGPVDNRSFAGNATSMRTLRWHHELTSTKKVFDGR